jgi:hypothetical protein
VTAMLGYYREATRPRLAAAVRRERPTGRPRVSAERMLVLWGAADPVLPVSTGESVVKDLGPECVMVTVPGAGHFVVEEAPDVVGEVLEDFLADRPPAHPVSPPEGPEHHRVEAGAGGADDALHLPSVGGVPVGGTPAEQARAAEVAQAGRKASARKAAKTPAEAGPVTKVPVTRVPAKKAAAKKAAVKQAPAKKAPVKKAPAKKAPGGPGGGPPAAPEGPPSSTA